MKQLVAKFIEHPLAAHLLAANDRYNRRLGPQFAAAITYFSVLSMVPVLMFAFSVVGFTVMVVNPELMVQIKAYLESQFDGDTAMGKSIGAVVEYALKSWNTVGIIAILTAGYSGVNWVGNLKRAVRVMWSRKFADASENRGFIVEMILNLLIFLGLIACFLAGILTTQLGSSLSTSVLNRLGWQSVPGIGFFWQLLTLALVFLSSLLLMTFLFVVLPNQAARPKAWVSGVLLGALFVTILQTVAGRLFSAFAGNPAAAVFGPVIVMMLVFNLLATSILITAAWVGTDGVWREELQQKNGETPAKPAQSDIPRASALTVKPRVMARLSEEELRRVDPELLPSADKNTYVRQDVAFRGAKISWGLGYGIGAATGLGLGAALVGVLRWLAQIFSRSKTTKK